MNHKEEAIKRVEEFYPHADEAYHDSKTSDELHETRILSAKQCALLAIKNEMELLNLVFKRVGSDYDNALIEHLRLIGLDLIDIKKEIENL